MLSKARFRELLQFTRKKERAAQGLFWVEGWRWLEEALALAEPPQCVIACVEQTRSPAEAELLEHARARAGGFFEVTAEQLARLTETVTPPGVAALVRWRPAAVDELLARLSPPKPALLVALDAVGDPGNAGTIVRTADWFGAAGVLFGANSAEPTNPKTVRATMGSLFHLPIVEAAQLEQTLEAIGTNSGVEIVGAALDGEPLTGFQWPARTALVIGNEANGIRPEVAQRLYRRVRIPSYGRAESLNAAVAAAILIADWRRAWRG